MVKYKTISLALLLGGMVLAFPVWLFGSEKNYLQGEATVTGTGVQGLLPRIKRRDPYLSDRKSEIYIHAKTDGEADSYALDLDCLFNGPKGSQKFTTYYATYPTRALAEAEAAKLKGRQIKVHYDKTCEKRIALDGELEEDAGLVPIFAGATVVFLLGSVLSFIRSFYR